MAKGRGGAIVAMVVLCLLALALQYKVVQAATYVVGGKDGWTYDISGWENGKKFKAHDVLVFNYPKDAHNVVAVNKTGYDECNTIPTNAKVYTSGKDRISLVKGYNYFICDFPTHCDTGMNIQIFAS